METRERTIFALCLACAAVAGGADELADSFRSPPRAAAPHVWWHWMNGNVTKEGITADLEAMREIGLAGAQSFDCGCGIRRNAVQKGPHTVVHVFRPAAGTGL